VVVLIVSGMGIAILANCAGKKRRGYPCPFVIICYAIMKDGVIGGIGVIYSTSQGVQ